MGASFWPNQIVIKYSVHHAQNGLHFISLIFVSGYRVDHAIVPTHRQFCIYAVRAPRLIGDGAQPNLFSPQPQGVHANRR